jgi:heme-degrading monooxygenase HmoA
MIGRMWRGWAKPDQADAYEKLLTTETLPALHRVSGYKGSYFMRRPLDVEVEIVEITFWESMSSIEAFAGADSTKAVVPPETQVFLTRWDERSVHFAATWCP